MKEAKPPQPLTENQRKGLLTPKGDTAGIMQNGIIVMADYNTKLTGTRGVQVYNEMRSGDATIAATLLAINLPITGANWRVEQVGDGKKAREIRDYVHNALFVDPGTTFEQQLEEILLYLVFGRMPFEILYKFLPDGRITLDKLLSIWPDTIWEWRTKEKTEGITQRTINGTFSIPMQKLAIFVNKKENNNWEGRSILRSSYKHWYIKEKLYLIDAIAAERQGLGVPYAKMKTGALEQDISKMEELLENMRANEKGFLIIPPEVEECGFMDMKSGTTKPLKPSIDHHDRAMALNVLAQFLMLGQETGSYALSKSHSELFILSLESVVNYVKSIYQRHIIPNLVKMNYDTEEFPELQTDKIGTVDSAALGTALGILVDKKLITPDPSIERHLRSVYDLPEYEGVVPDTEMVDEAMTEADSAMNELAMLMGGDGEEEPTAELTEEDLEAMERLLEVNIAGSKGIPLSEETKKKISEALSKGKGKAKAKNPEITAKRKEMQKLRKEVAEVKDTYKRKILEMRAKGEKLEDDQKAKLELEIFDKTKGIKDKIDKLRDEIESAKDKEVKPEPEKKTSMDLIIKLSDQLDTIMDAVA